MTHKNFKNSQLPRASRASTQDALEHAKGDVCYETGSTGRISPENEGAEKLFDRSGSVKQYRGDDTVRGV
jgi:hypothetical protein